MAAWLVCPLIGRRLRPRASPFRDHPTEARLDRFVMEM